MFLLFSYHEVNMGILTVTSIDILLISAYLSSNSSISTLQNISSCLTADVLCNDIVDCPDGYDEVDCVYTCDFDDVPTSSRCRQWLSEMSSDNRTGFILTNGVQSYNDTNAVVGPPRDHSLNSSNGGYALFLNAAHQKGIGVMADIVTGWYEAYRSNNTCHQLLFAVNMYGAAVGQLHVYVRLRSSADTLRRIWSCHGDKGARWINYTVPLGVLYSQFQLVFRAIRGHGEDGYIAIDSIALQSCAPEVITSNGCMPNEFRCTTHICIPGDRVCDLEPDCIEADDENEALCVKIPKIGKCDFERDMCGWTPVIHSSSTEWKRNCSGTLTHVTTPTVDHTTGRYHGHYVYMDASKVSAGSRALLESPVFPAPPYSAYNFSTEEFSNCQLRFFYHMYGRHIGDLSVHILEVRSCLSVSCRQDALRIYNQYWTATLPANQWDGAQDVWMRASIPLPFLTNRYIIQLEASGMLRSRGGIAVDDISLSAGCFEADQESWPVEHHLNIDTTLVEHNNISLRYTFTTCGSRGRYGPSQHQCNIAYQETKLVVNVTKPRGRLPGGIQKWTVPHTGLYSITANGASGGAGLYNPELSKAGYVHAKFELIKGELLYLLVGQQGDSACLKKISTNQMLSTLCQQGHRRGNITFMGGGGGGGGATYVFKFDEISNQSEPLTVAGGGGGKSTYLGKLTPTVHGGFTSYGSAMSSVGMGLYGPGAGGGWFSISGLSYNDGRAGTNNSDTSVSALGGLPCLAAQEFGWETTGGFGGGGGGCKAGGAGGGYTGGTVSITDDPNISGHGGTSYIGLNATEAYYVSGATIGDGSVDIIYEVSCPCQHLCIYNNLLENYTCFCDDHYELASDGLRCIEKRIISGPHFSPALTSIVAAVVTVIVAALVLLLTRIFWVRYRQKRLKKTEHVIRLWHFPLNVSSGPGNHFPVLSGNMTRPGIQPLPDSVGMVTEYNPNYNPERAEPCKSLASVEHGLLEIPLDKLLLVRSIGHGAFGEVFQGILLNMTVEASRLHVAAKTLSGLNTDQSEMDFFMEALIMSKFHHPNIVRLIGVCFQSQPRMIVLELLDGGDIKTFLRQSRPTARHPSCLTQLDLIRLALDVALGCQYLEQNHFIHRDIAARNCLLTSKSPDRVAKIADFGMARDIYSADYYRKGGRTILPVKWMPPEAFLDGVFTSKTDVWSFGVLMWEIFSLGYVPYPGQGNQEVMQLVASGSRLDSPQGCPTPVYAIMASCWRSAATNRPPFSEIIEKLQQCMTDPQVIHAPLPAGQATVHTIQSVEMAACSSGHFDEHPADVTQAEPVNTIHSVDVIALPESLGSRQPLIQYTREHS